MKIWGTRMIRHDWNHWSWRGQDWKVRDFDAFAKDLGWTIRSKNCNSAPVYSKRTMFCRWPRHWETTRASNPSFLQIASLGRNQRPATHKTTVPQRRQSINNTYPQVNLPIVLEALVDHPKLESLKIYDMVCNERALEAIGKIISVPESRLRVLGLKNNLSHPRSSLPGVSQYLLPALSKNNNLTYLKLSGNNLNDEHMIQVGRTITESRTLIQTLSLSDNLISNSLLPLASRLNNAKSLRCLDLLRNPIQKESKKAMVASLKNNVHLERLDLDGSWDDEKFWWLSLNKGGRRALQAKNIPSSLWPTILERAYRIPIRKNSKHRTTNAGVAYYLIRRIPWLFEKASTSKPFVVSESRPEKRLRIVVKDDSMETEPKAKRINNAWLLKKE